MRCKRSVPDNDMQLQEQAFRYLGAAKTAKVFQSDTAKPLVNALEQVANAFKVGCEEARFLDRMKVAAKNLIKKELKLILKKVIHFMEAMAGEEDFLELQQFGVEMVKPRVRKKKSSKADQQDATVSTVQT